MENRLHECVRDFMHSLSRRGLIRWRSHADLESNPEDQSCAEVWLDYVVALVGRSATFTWKNGRLGFMRIPGFVPLQKYCSPIRLQYSSGSSGCYVTLNRARAVELSCLPFEQLCPRRILDSHTVILSF